MSIKILSVKFAAAAAAALTVVAGGMASAATPTTPTATHTAPAPPAVSAGGAHVQVKAGAADSNSFDVVNDTPYVMTRTQESYNGKAWPDIHPGPPATLQPGQTSSTIYVAAGGFPIPDSDVAHVEYQFTDVNGGLHVLKMQTSDAYLTQNWDAGMAVWASDILPGGAQVASTEFAYSTDGSSPRNVHARLLHPAQFTVDAAKDPARAAAIMTQFAAGTGKAYTPTTGVVYTTSAATAVTGRFINQTSEPAVVLLTHSITNSETTSLGAEAGWSSTLNILGFANTTVSASINTSHTWGNSSTTADSASLNLAPGQTGWITRATMNGTVTGDFDFTNALGIVYHVHNVTVTAQSVADPTRPQIPAFTYGQGWNK